MYKVFLNEKLITLSNKSEENIKSIPFTQPEIIGQIIDELQHTPTSNITIYHPDLKYLWIEFKNYFTEIHAAGGIVENLENKTLWIHRLNKWDLPKGKMEAGETEEISAKREIEEECNIFPIEISKKITTTYHIYYLNTYILKHTHWFSATYSGDNPLIPQIEEGIDKVVWANDTEVYEFLNHSYGNIKLVWNEYKSL